jgi:hypothetical protein
MLVVNILKTDIGRIALYQSQLLSESNSSRQVELKVPSSRFLSPSQNTVHDPEERSQSIFSSTVSSRWHLDDESVDRSIGPDHCNSSEAVAVSSSHLDRRRESSNLGKIVSLINVFEVLAGHVDFVEFGMVEFVEVATVLIEGLSLAAAIQASFIDITPILQAEDVFLEREAFLHEISFDCAL